MINRNGLILYDGPSMIDGARIICIATGFARRSKNTKTGAMIQTWILRADIHPLEAIKHGTDRSICGDCPLRGPQRICYVRVGQAPSMVWQAWLRGSYAGLNDLRVFQNRIVRFGSYGDPAALPPSIVATVGLACEGHTGYTHQWRSCNPVLREFLMASADRESDRVTAKLRGWRVFRIYDPDIDGRLAGEVICPATRGKLTCATCLACSGAGTGRRGDIVVPVHGTAAGIANYRRAVAGATTGVEHAAA